MRALGIDLGATNIKIGVVSKNGELSSHKTFRTPRKIEDVVNLIADYYKRISDKIDVVGVGVPGPLNAERTIIYKACNIPGWKNVPLKKLLERKLGVDVVIENDANVAAWAEYKCGRAINTSSHVLYTLGTGIGGGIVVNGELIIGAKGLAAELGHVQVHPNGRKCGCGARGCLEAYASASAIERRYQVLSGRLLTCKDVFDRFSSDRHSRKAITEACEALAIGISNITCALDPDVIVLAGGMSYNSAMIIGLVQKELKNLLFGSHGLRIVSSVFKNLAGVIGAGLWALKKYEISA